MSSEGFDPEAGIAVQALVPVSVIESQERAQIDMQVATAKRYPRDLEKAQRRMEKMATADLETAESCSYHLERDGHSIEGPSVRMAEIAVTCYGNIRFGIHVVSNDGKVVIAQGYCHDVENNVFAVWETQRRITDKRGRTYSEDMQITTANAAGAIAFRNAVFKVIPRSIVKPVEDAARKYAVGDLKTLVARRTRVLKRFAVLGVREDRIFSFLGYQSAEEITVEDIERLIGIGTAIKEGTTTIEETFGSPAPAKPNIPKKEARAPEKTEQKTEPTKPVRPEGELFGPSAGLKSPLEELRMLLAREEVTEKEFLGVIAFQAAARDSAEVLHSEEEVEAGTFTLGEVGDKYLRLALGAFTKLIDDVKKRRRGEPL